MSKINWLGSCWFVLLVTPPQDLLDRYPRRPLLDWHLQNTTMFNIWGLYPLCVISVVICFSRFFLWDVRFSWRWIWSMQSSGCQVVQPDRKLPTFSRHLITAFILDLLSTVKCEAYCMHIRTIKPGRQYWPSPLSRALFSSFSTFSSSCAPSRSWSPPTATPLSLGFRGEAVTIQRNVS